MMHHQFLRIKKLTGKNIIHVAAKHNHREILAELGAGSDSHIDPVRTCNNIILRGCSTAAEVASMAQSLLDNAEIKALRKDAVRGLEIIFGLPANMPIDQRAFFADAVQWIEQHFQAPVISAIIHNDEAAPHCHVLILPLVKGRMIGSDLMGNPTKLHALQTDFHAEVGQRYGLIKQTAPKRLSATIRRQAASNAIGSIKSNHDLLNKPSVKQSLIDLIAANPEPLTMALGLTMPTVTARKGDFAKLMTKPCKPEKPIGFDQIKPIGFVDAVVPKKEQTLSCVGFGNSVPLIPSTPDQQSTIMQDDYQRERDSETASSYWDEVRGEFVRVGVKKSSKAQIVEAVHSALAARSRNH